MGNKDFCWFCFFWGMLDSCVLALSLFAAFLALTENDWLMLSFFLIFSCPPLFLAWRTFLLAFGKIEHGNIQNFFSFSRANRASA